MHLVLRYPQHHLSHQLFSFVAFLGLELKYNWGLDVIFREERWRSKQHDQWYERSADPNHMTSDVLLKERFPWNWGLVLQFCPLLDTWGYMHWWPFVLVFDLLLSNCLSYNQLMMCWFLQLVCTPVSDTCFLTFFLLSLQKRKWPTELSLHFPKLINFSQQKAHSTKQIEESFTSPTLWLCETHRATASWGAKKTRLWTSEVPAPAQFFLSLLR